MLKREHGLELTLNKNGKDGEPIPIPLLDANEGIDTTIVIDPNNARQNIYQGKVTGFSKGFVDEDTAQNFVNVWFVKTGLVEKWVASNCENTDAYPCSVTTYYANRLVEKEGKCVGIDDQLFPNNDTVGMSFEMSQDIYFAYRDLGRFIARKIKRARDGALSVETKPRGINNLIPLHKCKLKK